MRYFVLFFPRLFFFFFFHIKSNRKEKNRKLDTLLLHFIHEYNCHNLYTVFDCQHDQITKKKKKKNSARSCHEKIAHGRVMRT